jgi:uncharacterized ferredoxin-like protein
MAKLASDEVERQAIRVVATMMASSARTAPKGRGVDDVKTLLVEGDDIEALARAMEDKADEKPPYLSPAFRRDARNLRSSTYVLLVGVSGEPKKIDQPLDCGACGYKTCRRLLNARKKDGNDFSGPLCIFQAIDLGIALSSAVKLASELNVDNRLMYTVGAAARRLGLLNADVIIGIPLSAGGKNPYFDRQ